MLLVEQGKRRDTVKCPSCSTDVTDIGRPMHPACSALDVDPDIVATQLFTLIDAGIRGQPRSLQKRIGPSEIGVPCDRRLGYRLGGVTEVNRADTVAWKPFVGTAVHEQFANIIARHEIARFTDGTVAPRYMVEHKVNVGQILGVDITGSCDLFDSHTGTVVDWKFTTRNMIRENYRPNGPGEQYRTQAHLYGRGFARAGYDVRNVMIVFLTRDGEFHDRWVWSEPYDETVATDALARATSIATAIEALGNDFTIPTLPAADAHCNWCPWHKQGASDLTRSCPGMTQHHAPTSLSDALGTATPTR